MQVLILSPYTLVNLPRPVPFQRPGESSSACIAVLQTRKSEVALTLASGWKEASSGTFFKNPWNYQWLNGHTSSSNTKEVGGSQPRETLSFGERSRLLLKATAVINKDDVISKFLGCPGIPRAKETGSQSLLSQWTLTCLTVPSESAQSPGPDGFLHKDQGLCGTTCEAGGQHRDLWTAAFGLWWGKRWEFYVWRVLWEISVRHTFKQSRALSQDARSFLQFQQSFWEEDPCFRILLSIIIILQKHKRSLVFVALGTPKLPNREEIGSSQRAWLLFTFLLYFCFFPLLPHHPPPNSHFWGHLTKALAGCTL